MIFTDYGQPRDVDCTPEELEIYEVIRSLFDTDTLRLVRKSDSYVSACMESSGDYGLMDVARFKFTDRAKWIKIGPDFDKVKIGSPSDVKTYAEELAAAYLFNEPYL